MYRQSISKWETDTSIPELDKLIQLSDLFQIPIDEMVRCGEVLKDGDVVSADASRGETNSSELSVQRSQSIVSRSISTQKIVGLILFTVGLLCCVLAFALGSGLFFFGGYLPLCGAICLLAKSTPVSSLDGSHCC